MLDGISRPLDEQLFCGHQETLPRLLEPKTKREVRLDSTERSQANTGQSVNCEHKEGKKKLSLQ